MVFSSLSFIFVFLPIVLLCLNLAKNNTRAYNFILTASSVYFYFVGEKGFVLVLLASSVIDYTIGSKIHSSLDDPKKAKFYLKFSIFANLSFLFLFKYSDFFVDQINQMLRVTGSAYQFPLPQIHLPLGISFFTFQTLSYSIDVYRRKVPASHNFPQFMMYVTMFPQLVAGPIVRYIHVIDQLGKKQFQLAVGVERFVIGLAKKVIIADAAAFYADLFFNSNPANLVGPNASVGAWAGAIAYTIQIYFDFSGYSDMAIGLGKILGFTFPENFRHPYTSLSLQDFWRRWHISLSTWFRDYVYIPLGGNRLGPGRTYANQIIVFFLCGLWHGASWNFIAWGLYHGLVMSAEKLCGKQEQVFKFKPLSRIYTILIVMIGWVYFRAVDIHHANAYIGKMFSFDSLNFSALQELPREFYVVCLMGAVFSSPHAYETLMRQKDRTRYVVLSVLFLTSVSLLSVQSFSPFIYFRF